MTRTMNQKLEFLSTCQTGYVNDALGLLGIKNCSIANLLPLRRGEVVVGQAFTAQLTRNRGKEKSYTLYEVAETCPKGKVLVYAGGEGFALIGDNIATLMNNKGIKGVILDGKCRDVDDILELSMPVFCEGATTRLTPSDLQITDLDVSIFIREIKINPGDVIIGDSDGAVVIPLEQLDDVIKQVEWVAQVEEEAAEALKNKAISAEEFQKIIFKKRKPRI